MRLVARLAIAIGMVVHAERASAAGTVASVESTSGGGLLLTGDGITFDDASAGDGSSTTLALLLTRLAALEKKADDSAGFEQRILDLEADNTALRQANADQDAAFKTKLDTLEGTTSDGQLELTAQVRIHRSDSADPLWKCVRACVRACVRVCVCVLCFAGQSTHLCFALQPTVGHGLLSATLYMCMCVCVCVCVCLFPYERIP